VISILISKATKRKVSEFWKNRCAICGNNDFLEFHHIIPVAASGTKETKERLHLSQKTHLTESSLYKRYKREHNIDKFYNNVDLINSKRRTHV